MREKKEIKSVRASVRLTPTLNRKARALAKKSNKTFSEYVGFLIAFDVNGL